MNNFSLGNDDLLNCEICFLETSSNEALGRTKNEGQALIYYKLLVKTIVLKQSE